MNRRAPERRKRKPESKASARPVSESPPARPHDSELRPKSEALFPIVAIGASAGGLAALKELFAHVPEDTGLAYVVVVHLSPEHESHLEELLQPHVKMPVEQVKDATEIEPNHVYVIPPNANLDTIDTHLRLTRLEARRQERAPIDHFFRTLAETHDGHAIGVVLTGTGSDGTLGLRRIKERGGLTIVQDPEEAEYDGMPRSAIASTPIDLVLPLGAMPEAILRFAHTEPRLTLPEDGEEADSDARQFLHKVFAQIRARTGRDFSHYKRSTLLRRITRRMQFSQIAEPSAYVELLRKQPEEVNALADDLLITVTSFFRDVEVFDVLEQRIVPQLFVDKTATDSVRVWSVGCATGEEAYSLAMLLLEEAGRRDVAPAIQVFASDLHLHSLEKAREGFYPGDIDADVRPDRLKRFFQREGGGYRVRKEVRELVIFAPHNLLADPPFSRIDLIACRNLLIYLQRELQQQVTELFHYALQPSGFLVLGTSENTDAGQLFRVVDKRHGLFRKRNVPPPEPRLPVFPLARGRLPEARIRSEAPQDPAAYRTLHQRLLEQHGPPSVLVSPDDNVVHFSTRAGRYLLHPGGVPTTNLFKLAREELRIELRASLPAVRAQKRPIRTKPILVRFNGESGPVVLELQPSLEPEQEGFVLLLFGESPQQVPDRPSAKDRGELDAELNAKLRENESDKQLAEQRLQAIIEEYETSQEEIKASNEELQTVNQENRHKVEELAQLSSDLQNLLVATDIATLFLDRELRILRFTPKIAELFNVRMSDRGRPLSDFTSSLGYDLLAQDAQAVLERLIPVEREIGDQSGRWYLTRVLPYRTGEDRIAGVVVTFVEITVQKQAQETLRDAKEYFEHIIQALPEPLLVLSSKDLRVHSANDAFYDAFQLDAEQTKGRSIYELGSGQWSGPAFRELFEVLLPERGTVKGHQVEVVVADMGRRVVLINARRLPDSKLILLGMHDISERFAAEQALRLSEERLRRMVNVQGVGVMYFDARGRVLDANESFQEMFGYSREDVQSRRLTWRDMTPVEYIELSEAQQRKLEETGRIGPYEKEYLHKDGTRSWVAFAGASLGDGNTVEYCIDVSDRKRIEQALRHSEALLAAELSAMRRLHELVLRLLVSRDLEHALGQVLLAALDISDAPMGLVQLLDSEGTALRIVAHHGFESSVLEDLKRIDPQGDSVFAQALNARERVVVEDADAVPEQAPRVAGTQLAAYVGVQITPLLSREGAVLGLLSTHYARPYRPSERDLRLLDLLARQAADFLEHRQAEQALRLSETRLASENRNKDEYLAMLGHELRNPLAAIRNATELVRRATAPDPQLSQVYAVLDRQSSHMLRIMDGLLEVARIARGKVHLVLKAVELHELLVRLVDDASTHVLGRGLELSLNAASEPLWVQADEIRLVQVFDNLIGNALKFTQPPGRIDVVVARENESALVRIRDTGVGIRPEMLPRIFESFQQEPQDAARSKGGLGLGLALAKGLVELHHGALTARSQGPGTGSEFEVRLPLAAPPEHEPESDPAPDSAPRRVLVVEDNADAALVLSALLSGAGHQVSTVASVDEALGLLRERGFDIVLCDLGLPGLSGFDLARAVRSDPALRDMPLVALTGYSQSEDRKHTHEAGFDEHLVKPIDLAGLEAVIGRFAGSSRTA